MASPSSSPAPHNFSPEINDLIRRDFFNYRQKIEQLFHNQRLPLEIHTLLRELDRQIEQLSSCIIEKHFQKLERDSGRIVIKIDALFNAAINPEQQDPYTQEQKRAAEAKAGFTNHLRELKPILKNLRRYESQAFETLVDNRIGARCLKILISMGNQEAKAALVQLLHGPNPGACQILVDLVNSMNPEDGPVIDDILTLLSREDQGDEYLFRLLTQHTDFSLFKRAMTTFEDSNPISPQFLQCLVWALPDNFLVLYNFMTACLSDSRGDFTEIIEALARQAYPQDLAQLQDSLVVVASELPSTNPCALAIERNLMHFDSPTVEGLSPASRLDRLRELTEYQTFRKLWSEFSPDVRLATKVLTLRREQTLLQVLSGTQYPRPSKRPILSCMPNVETLLLGSELGSIVFHPDVTTKLAAEGIQLCAFHSKETPIKNKKMVRCLAVDNDPTIWLQDSCTLLEDGEQTRIQIPQIVTDLSVLDRERLLARRERRMGACARSCSNGIGGRSVAGHQLDFVDCALEVDPLLLNAEIGLLYDEGGNSLVGEVASGPYQNQPFLLISQDALDINLELVQEELQTLGLFFEGGQWHQRAPYRAARVNFEQEDLLQLLAADRNIDARLIFPYPPADYHGDTFMCIGHNVVVINDSLKALEIEETFFRRDIRGKDQHKKKDYRQTHLPQARLRHQAETLAFQALRGPLNQLGIRVVMRPGRFKKRDQEPGPGRKDEANFFNHISLIAPSGKRIVVMPGCPSAYKPIAKEFVSKVLGFKQTEILFTPIEEMAGLLDREGAVRCTTKRTGRPL